MNNDQLEKLFAILTTADGGCRGCVQSLYVNFCLGFPEYEENLYSYVDKQDEYPFGEYLNSDDIKSRVNYDRNCK